MTVRQITALNALGLLGCCAALGMAFWYQFRFGVLPCPLCLLQRAAFTASGLGFALNLRFGPRPAHYGAVILSAAAGSVIAARQVALHVVPGTGGFGSTLFGLHFYTLALIGFMALIAGVGILLLADGTVARGTPAERGGSGTFGTACLLLFVGLSLTNAASTAAECGGGLCPDDPASYEALTDWLSRSGLH